MKLIIHHSIIFILCAVIFAVAGLQAKEMYRWTDENGVVHYSDQKPAGQQDYETSHLSDSAPAPAQPAAAASAAVSFCCCSRCLAAPDTKATFHSWVLTPDGEKPV